MSAYIPMQSLPISFSIDPSLARIATAFCRRVTPFGYCVSSIFFDSPQKKILFMAYVYFRWLDDLVDQPDALFESSYYQIGRQETIAHMLYDGNTIFPQNRPEKIIQQVIAFDSQNESGLRNMIYGFIQAIKWDVERRNQWVDQPALDNYSLNLGRSYADGLLYGLGLDPNLVIYNKAREHCGVASHITHLLRDLFIDFRLGYINISTEDRELFQIDLANPTLSTLREWILFKADVASKLFSKGRLYRYCLPTPRCKLLFDLSCLRYLHTLNHVIRTWRNMKILPKFQVTIQK